jgi:hypothetical protein
VRLCKPAPCVSIVVASNENNRGDNKNVFKSFPNLDDSKDDIPNKSLFDGYVKGLSPDYNGKG